MKKINSGNAFKSSVASLMLVSVLGACSREEAGPATAQPPDAQTSQEDVRAPVTSNVQPDRAELMGGYVPTFEHRLRSQREDRLEDGGTRHVAVVEYYVSDDEVERMVQADLESLRLNVTGPEAMNDSVRFVARNSKVGRMTADINRDPSLQLRPGANGVIRFSWVEAAR